MKICPLSKVILSIFVKFYGQKGRFLDCLKVVLNLLGSCLGIVFDDISTKGHILTKYFTFKGFFYFHPSALKHNQKGVFNAGNYFQTTSKRLQNNLKSTEKSLYRPKKCQNEPLCQAK